MHLIYLDESGDHYYGKQGTRHYVFSALAVPEDSWAILFERVKEFRRSIRDKYTVRPSAELHARELVAGRGNIGKHIVPKALRSRIFWQYIHLIANASDLGVYSINVAAKNRPGFDPQEWALERMINRINRTLEAKGSNGILIFDEGKELQTRRLLRRMHVFNPIPSAYGQWDDGSPTKNITIDHIIGDPFFKRSSDDYMIQAVDFVAFSLLKQEEEPTPRVQQFQLDRAFAELDPVLYKPASRKDPQGVVRL